MSNFKIFGHEPAAIVAAVEVVLAVLLSFGVFGLTLDQAGGVVAVVSAALALVVAYATSNTWVSALTGLVKAGLIAAATFGWALTESQQAAVLSAVAVVGGLLIRQNVSSLNTAVSRPSPGAHLRTEAGQVSGWPWGLFLALAVAAILLVIIL